MRATIPQCPSPFEYDEQVSFFREVFYTLMPKHPYLNLMHASLNGARVALGTAVKQKKAGMKAGVPDVVLPVARGPYHGLFIEFKRLPYRNAVGNIVRFYPKPEQKRFIAALKAQGYCAEVATGCDEGLRILKAYLALGDFRNTPAVEKAR